MTFEKVLKSHASFVSSMINMSLNLIKDFKELLEIRHDIREVHKNKYDK